MGQRLSSEYLKRLETDPEAEQGFTHDLFRLSTDGESFEWPTNDLGRCLALSVFREQTIDRLDEAESP